MKTVNINECILLLLYRRESVCLPDIGTISTQYRDASVDHVKGAISSPTLDLEFSAHQHPDDGKLTQEIATLNQISLPEAGTRLADYLLEMNIVLSRNEMFNIPGVGRFYLDYEKRIKFQSDGENFNTDTFGLPLVQAEPITRKTPLEAPAPVVKPPKSVNQAWWQRHILWITLSFIAILSAGIFFALSDQLQQAQQEPDSPLPEEYVNVSPAERQAGAPNPSDEAEEEELVPERPSPTAKTCTIRIGRFGNQDNVTRLSKKAMELGLNPYTRVEGKLTEIGISFEYENQQDINNMLKLVKKELSKDAIVDKK
jgi:hypothetical protein